MSTGSQHPLYYEQDRSNKDVSSEASSPHDLYINGSGGTASSTPAKRGVRHLTAAQLAKKRANDRESQRAIRERTKMQIERLESRVKELESGEAYQRLHTIVREKEVLQAENEEIRSRLASILAILQPIVDARAGQLGKMSHATETTSRVPQSPFDPSLHTQIVNPTQSLSSGEAASTASALDPLLVESNHSWRAEPGYDRQSPAPQYYNQSTQQSSESSGHEHHQSQSHLDGLSANNQRREDQHARNPSDRLRQFHRHPQSQYQTTSVPNSPLPCPFPVTVQERPGTAMGIHHESHASSVRSPEEPPPLHTQRPNNIRPTCHFDSIIFDFAAEARSRLSEGLSVEEVLGSPDPDLTTFLYPNVSPNGSLNIALLMDILKTFSAINRLPEKICVFMDMFTFMRWYISPTPENYEALPEHLRPVEAQVRVPHPIWVDMLPWPAMRAKLVFCYPSLPLDHFFVPYTLTLSVNWPGDGDIGTCLYRPEGRTTLHISPRLREHWCDITKYSLGIEFARSFPALADTCRIVDEEVREARTT